MNFEAGQMCFVLSDLERVVNAPIKLRFAKHQDISTTKDLPNLLQICISICQRGNYVTTFSQFIPRVNHNDFAAVGKMHVWIPFDSLFGVE